MNINNNNIEEKIKIILNLYNAANFDLVISKTKIIIKKFPEYVVLYNLLGSAYQNLRKFGFAKETFSKGLKLDPGNIAMMNNLANTLKQLGNFNEAENLFLKIIDKKPNYINAYVNYGNLKRDFNDFKSAIELYEKALKINDQIPLILYSLALAHQGLGNFNEAINFAEKVLLLDLKFTQADMLISQSTKYNSNSNHFKKMIEKIDNQDLNVEQKFNLHFALAKAFEDNENIKDCFKHLEQGNKLKRQTVKFDINEEIKLFNSIKKIFGNINFDKFNNKNSPPKKIIFILGMPRSGTTLVEQIISTHSDVFGAGELPYLSRVLQEELMTDNQLSLKKFQDLFNDKTLIQNLEDKFYNFLDIFNSKQNFITDKAPLNFRWIGLIKILFPSAKIIHCSRGEKDNCLSLYKNLFEGGLNFSYDQKELGNYYNLYQDLMNFWKKLLPETIFDVKYENIIENQEYESKKIIEFCNLSWQSDCLNFHKNKTPIKTMSTAQARKPIYRSSLNSFEKFSPYLEDLYKII